ncbi:MAG TPA: transglycosylase domain-containing protein, partial [Myxococcota bacterium]
LRAGRVVSGASTITQQLARRLVPRPRTLLGKAQEVLWALRLSAHLDKERVLLEYLNRVPLGNGAVGVEAAAHTYFDESAAMLSPAQAALLAGLAHAPAVDDPFRHPERALARRAVILARMRSLGSDHAQAPPALVDDDAFARALTEPLAVVRSHAGLRAPHFAQATARSLAARGLGDAVRVETGIDPDLQRALEQIIDEELRGPLAAANVGEAAALVVDNDSGRVLAYAGSRDFFDERELGMNDGVRAQRQPGSALKPFIYGLALSRGMTPATLLDDVDTQLATATGTYAPRNYDGHLHGPVRLRAALQNSYNIPAVHVAELLGPPRILDELHAAGFASLTDTAEHYGVGIVLGDGDVTLWEMAQAYRGLARGGVLSPLVDVVAASDGAGRALAVTAPFAQRRFLPAAAVAMLTDILSDDEARAPAFGVDDALSLPFPVAAKTGTSRAYVDNWTAGFTHERTVAVWAGNFDGRAMHHVSGITGAGAIFHRAMVAAMRGVDPAPLVDETRFERARICPLTGLLASASCPGAYDEKFLPGTAPRAACSSHHLVDDAARSPRRDTTPCAQTKRALDLDPRFTPWARGSGVALVDGARVCDRASDGAPHVVLLSPVDGDELVRDPGVPSGQGVPVKVRASGVARVTIRVDGAAPIELPAPYSLWLDAIDGEHEIVVDADGREVARAKYTVR